MSVKETYYLIDYENVHGSGLSGSERLGKHDHIVLFYTENDSKISLEKLPDGNSTNFNRFKIPVGKQSLDMHLVSYLNDLIIENGSKCFNYVIISKDKDYNDIISFWKKNFKKRKNKSSIIRQNQIATAQKILLNTEILQALRDEYKNTKNNAFGHIASIVAKYYEEDKFTYNVHNELKTTYPKMGEDIYETILPILERY